MMTQSKPMLSVGLLKRQRERKKGGVTVSCTQAPGWLFTLTNNCRQAITWSAYSIHHHKHWPTLHRLRITFACVWLTSWNHWFPTYTYTIRAWPPALTSSGGSSALALRSRCTRCTAWWVAPPASRAAPSPRHPGLQRDRETPARRRTQVTQMYQASLASHVTRRGSAVSCDVQPATLMFFCILLEVVLLYPLTVHWPTPTAYIAIDLVPVQNVRIYTCRLHFREWQWWCSQMNLIILDYI